MVMNAKKFQRPSDGHADRNSTEKPFRMGMTSAGDVHHALNKKLKPGKKPPGVNGNGCRRDDVDGRLSSQGWQQADMPPTDKKKKENDARSQKKKAEVQRTALRVCGEWSEHSSSSGKVYYYNYRTEVSRWEKPDGWTELSEDDVGRSKETRKKQKPQLMTRKDSLHSMHGPNDFQNNSSTEFPSPIFSSPSFPSPTSQGSFHLRSPPQFSASTAPHSDVLRRTFSGALQHPLLGNPFYHGGNFPPNSGQIPVLPWRSPTGYCDSSGVDGGKRSRGWSMEESMGKRAESSDGALYEDMDISPEGSPMIDNTRTSTKAGWTGDESSEGRPLRPRSSSQADLAFSAPDGASNAGVPNALSALRDFVRWTSDGFMEFENCSGLVLSSFNRSLVVVLDSLSRLDEEEVTTLANQPIVRQAVEMLQRLEMRFVHPQHHSLLQQLNTRLLYIRGSGQNHSSALSTSPRCSDPRLTATYTGTTESSESASDAAETGRRSSMPVEMTPPAVNHSCDNDLQRPPQESLCDSNADRTVPANMPCPSGATLTVPSPVAVLTPSLTNYVNNQLIQHVKEWPTEIIERQVKNAADETHLMCDLQWMRVSGELKNLRSLIRTNEILTTLAEQRALFLAQQVQDLEKGYTQFMTNYEF